MRVRWTELSMTKEEVRDRDGEVSDSTSVVVLLVLLLGEERGGIIVDESLD